MYCQKCGQQIDDKAAVCVHCGAKTMNNAKIKKPIYKRWWFWLIVVFLGLLIIGAAGGEETPEEAAPAASIQTNSAQETGEEEPTTEPTTEATEPQNAKTLQIGSMKFEIPNGVEITAEEDLLYTFALVPNETLLSVFATDASEFGSEGIDFLILLQHQTWMEDGEHSNETSITMSVGTYSVDFDQYNVDTDNGAQLYNMVGTFTDSQYVYTFYYTSGNQDSAGKEMFLELLETAEFEVESTDVTVTVTETQNSESSLGENITMGERNALREAKDYLAFSAFSYEGLIDQLEYEGYSHDEAVYAVDNCGADWNEQALFGALSYLDFAAFSYTGLIEQLEYEEFTTEQATYGADNCGADWNEQAVKCAESYLEYSAFSKSELIEQLEYEGFTHEQAIYGAEANGY